MVLNKSEFSVLPSATASFDSPWVPKDVDLLRDADVDVEAVMLVAVSLLSVTDGGGLTLEVVALGELGGEAGEVGNEALIRASLSPPVRGSSQLKSKGCWSFCPSLVDSLYS